MRDIVSDYFSVKGELKRKEYWFLLLPLLVAANLLGWYLGSQEVGAEQGGEAIYLMIILIACVLVFARLVIVAKRIVDIGFARYWALLAVVPLLGDILALFVGFIPSKAEK